MNRPSHSRRFEIFFQSSKRLEKSGGNFQSDLDGANMVHRPNPARDRKCISG
jgi:hypothetical protein